MEAGSQEIKKPAGEAGFFIFAPGAERALRAGCVIPPIQRWDFNLLLGQLQMKGHTLYTASC
ncbi:hypothetical protein A8H26_20835 [Pluralibacter gergoviae]|nr:hypothetical protein A8H26_20835 [Pluralibacter gergoviae]